MTPQDAFLSTQNINTHTWKRETYALVHAHRHTLSLHTQNFSRQLQFNHFSQALHCLFNQAYLSISFSISFLHWKKFQFYVCAHRHSVDFGAALSALPDFVSIVTATEHFLCSD